jgi:monoamine oxidase
VLGIYEEVESVRVVTEGGELHAEQVISTLPLPVYKKMEVKSAFDLGPLVEALPYTPIHQVHFRAEPRDYNLWSDGPMERIFTHRDASGAPTGLYRAWINGRGATHQMITANAYDTPRLALPELMGGEVEILNTVAWTGFHLFSGGAYRHFQPGQSKAFGRAFEDQSGRVRFAGEHSSLFHTGMEGAMESAEREVYSLLGY